MKNWEKVEISNQKGKKGLEGKTPKELSNQGFPALFTGIKKFGSLLCLFKT